MHTKWLKIERMFIRTIVYGGIAFAAYIYSKIIEQNPTMNTDSAMVAFGMVIAVMIALMVGFEKVTNQQIKLIEEKNKEKEND